MRSYYRESKLNIPHSLKNLLNILSPSAGGDELPVAMDSCVGADIKTPPVNAVELVCLLHETSSVLSGESYKQINTMSCVPINFISMVSR